MGKKIGNGLVVGKKGELSIIKVLTGSSKIKKDEFKVEIDHDTIYIWDGSLEHVGSACTESLMIEDLNEKQIEKLTLLAKKNLMEELKLESLTPDSVAKSIAYKIANPRK